MYNDDLMDVIKSTLPSVRQEGQGVTIAELMEETGLSRSTASRKLETLDLTWEWMIDYDSVKRKVYYEE